jgi:beta-lactamase regulating signal transducer with metallopeptidase domain/protocatechuate 3,4-dioxygenase beta subunit
MSILECLLSNVMIAAGLALAAVLISRLVNKPQITHALWVLVLVKLVTPPVVHIPVGYAGAEPLETLAVANAAPSGMDVLPVIPPDDGSITTHDSAESVRLSQTLQTAIDSGQAPGLEADVHGDTGTVASPVVPWATALIGAWAAGSILWFVLAGIRLVRFKRLLGDAQPASGALLAEVRSIAGKYGLRRLPRVLVVDASLPPLIFSFGRRSSVVLPRPLLDSLGADERLGLLAHELAHLRRYDHWVRWLEFAVLGVYWWNPIAWWARRHIQQAEEECCDAWVLWAFPGKACQYAQTLVDTVDFLVGSSRLKPEVATAFNQGHSLKRRIEMIVNERISRRLSWRTKVVLVLFAAVVAPLSLLGASGDMSKAEKVVLISEERQSQRPGNEEKADPPLVPAAKAMATHEATDDVQVSGQKSSIKERPSSLQAIEGGNTIHGRVLRPDGEPIAGAGIDVLTFDDSGDRHETEATTAADGTFRVEVDLSGSSFARVIAHASGYSPNGRYSPDWSKSFGEDGVTLRLGEPGPAIRGRITDGDDRPVADAKISVLSVKEPKEQDLTAWTEALKTGKETHSLMLEHLRPIAVNRQELTLKTGTDGTFVLEEIGAERMVTLMIESPAIETSTISVMTRPAEKAELPYYRNAPSLGTSVFYGAEFEHRVPTAKPVVGVVRDQDTGEPLAGVQLRGEPPLHAGGQLKWVETTSDAEGRYRMTGLPRTGRTKILAIPPDNQPYMLSQLKVKDVPESEETTLDFALKRGIWIDGQVTDKATGEAVEDVSVYYYVFTDNPHAKEARGLSGAIRGRVNPYNLSRDGSFRRVGLPGRGLIAVRVVGEGRYRFGMGAEEIEGGTPMSGFKLFRTYPSMCNSHGHNAVVEINPTEDQDRIECNIALDSGAAITGEVLDPDGKPLAGALVRGVDGFGGWAREPLAGSEFQAVGYNPAEPRHMFFLHKERRLAGSLTIRGEQPGKLTLRLQPWATISGRIVDGHGNSKGGLEIHGGPGPKQDPVTGEPPAGPLPTHGKSGPQRIYTADDGTFKIEGLVPGARYNVQVHDKNTRTFGIILWETVLQPGEVRPIGDIPLEDPDVLRARYGVE